MIEVDDKTTIVINVYGGSPFVDPIPYPATSPDYLDVPAQVQSEKDRPNWINLILLLFIVAGILSGGLNVTRLIPNLPSIQNILKTESTKDVARQKIANAAIKYYKSGKDFKPGQKARCQDFVNEIMEQAGWKIPDTKSPIDGEYVGEYMANRWAGKDRGKIIPFNDPEKGFLAENLKHLRPGMIAFWTATQNQRVDWIGRRTPDITHVGIVVSVENQGGQVNAMVVDRGSSVKHREITSFRFGRYSGSGKFRGQPSLIAVLDPDVKYYN